METAAREITESRQIVGCSGSCLPASGSSALLWTPKAG